MHSRLEVFDRGLQLVATSHRRSIKPLNRDLRQVLHIQSLPGTAMEGPQQLPISCLGRFQVHDIVAALGI